MTDNDWQLVPKEPTKEMIQACIWALDRWREKHGNVQGFVPPGDKYQVRWRAMLEAAPTAASSLWRTDIQNAPKDRPFLVYWRMSKIYGVLEWNKDHWEDQEGDEVMAFSDWHEFEPPPDQAGADTSFPSTLRGPIENIGDSQS